MKNIQLSRKKIFTTSRRIVIKVGSAVLTNSEQGLDYSRIERLASDISSIVKQGRQVILVSSGAIAAGLARLGLKKNKNMPLSLKQAAAAIGQSALMWAYEKTFATHAIKVAQVLLTREDLSNRTRFLNARNTLQTLLDYGVIPIINENDTVSVDEIKFGDNDILSGMVVHLADADLLVILSDIDGLYTADPKLDRRAELIPVVDKITAEVEHGAGDAQTPVGTGGMRSKIMTAKKVGAIGVPMAIVNGKKIGMFVALFECREVGTLFCPLQKDAKVGNTGLPIRLRHRVGLSSMTAVERPLSTKEGAFYPGGLSRWRGISNSATASPALTGTATLLRAAWSSTPQKIWIESRASRHRRSLPSSGIKTMMKLFTGMIWLYFESGGGIEHEKNSLVFFNDHNVCVPGLCRAQAK